MNKYQYILDNCTGPAPKPLVKPKPKTGIQKELESQLDAIQLEYLKEFARREMSEWIEIKKGGARPTGEDHLLVVRGPEDSRVQCVGYFNRLMKTYVVDGQRIDGLDVTHFKELDWPAPPETKGAL